MKKTLIAASLSVVLALPAAAASRPPHATPAKTHAVALKHIKITPKALEIRRGETVIWTWGDKLLDSSHNVTSYGKARFRSSPTQSVGTYSVKFTRKGTYTYRCTIHPLTMKATIIVR
ncbi:MAG: cupredoxin domain-containing protein [Solirubrobacteraceae bacterium]